MNCPHCSGCGDLIAHVNRGHDISKHTVERITCRTCSGTGMVSDDVVRRIALGKLRREERLSRGESLLDASRRIGISPAALSAIELGRGPAEAYFD